MNTEQTVPTGEETQNPPPEAEEKPVAPEATPDADPKVESEETPEQRLKKLERELKKAQRNNSRLYAETQALKGKPEPKPEESPNQLSKDEVERLASQRADQIADAKMFAKSAEKIVEEGRKLDPKFMEQLNELRTVVGEFVQNNGLPSPFMKAVLEVSDNPTRLLHHLGKNPDIADDLQDLTPLKLAARLDRIDRSLDPPTPKQSSAPKPIEPVRGQGTVAKDPSQMTDREFNEWRRKQIAARH